MADLDNWRWLISIKLLLFHSVCSDELGKCYYVSTQHTSWNSAKHLCRNNGYSKTLVNIRSLTEQKFIKQMLENVRLQQVTIDGGKFYQPNAAFAHIGNYSADIGFDYLGTPMASMAYKRFSVYTRYTDLFFPKCYRRFRYIFGADIDVNVDVLKEPPNCFHKVIQSLN